MFLHQLRQFTENLSLVVSSCSRCYQHVCFLDSWQCVDGVRVRFRNHKRILIGLNRAVVDQTVACDHTVQQCSLCSPNSNSNWSELWSVWLSHGARGSFILDRKSHWIPSFSCLAFPAIVSKDVEINGSSKSTEVGLLFKKKKEEEEIICKFLFKRTKNNLYFYVEWIHANPQSVQQRQVDHTLKKKSFIYARSFFQPGPQNHKHATPHSEKVPGSIPTQCSSRGVNFAFSSWKCLIKP